MSLFSLMATLGLDSSGYERGLDDAEGKASSFGSKVGAGLKNFAKVGMAALTAVSGAAVTFGVSAVKTGQEFDVSMSQIAATMGMTMSDIQNNVNGAGEVFDALREKAIQMGSETNFTATQAAEGLNILAMSGYDATQSMDMLEDVLHLAAAGSMDMASAAAYISGTMKGFNDATKDSGYYADLMAKGATLANTSVSELGDAMSAGAAGAAAYSQDAESMTVALLRLAEQGVAGAAAGTALSAAMKDLYTPSDQAKDALTALGVAAYDANGSARDFNTVVNELDEALAGYSEQEKNAYKQTIFGIQGLNAYNKMTVTGVQRQNEWSKALAAASEGAGEAAKQYDTMTDNLQGDLDILGSAFDGLKLAVSDTLTSSAREFVQFGSDALSAITEGFKKGGIDGAMSSIGEMISQGLALVTKKIPQVVKVGLSLLQALVKGIVDNLPQVADAGIEIVLMLADTVASNLPSLLTAFGQAMSQMAERITDPETLNHFLTSVLALITWLAQAMIENAPALMESAETVLNNLITFVTENTPRFISKGIEIIGMLAQGLLDAIPSLIEQVPVILDSIISVITDNLPLIIESGVTLLSSLLQGIMDNVPLVISTFLTILDTITGFLTDNLPEILESGIELLMSLVEGILEAIPDMLEYLPRVIEAILNFVVQNLPLIIQMGIRLLTSLAEGIIRNLPAIIQATLTVINSILDYILKNLPMIIQMGIQLVQSLVQGLLNNLPALIQAAMQLISGLLNGIIQRLPQIIAMGIQLVGQLIVGLIQAIPQIIAALPQIFSAIINGFKEVDWGDIGRNIIEGIKNGVINFASNLWNAAKEAVNGAIQGVKNFLGIHSPSRVFRDEVGKMIGLGLAEGIEGSTIEAVQAAENMAEDVLGEMGVLDNLNSDFSGQMMVNPGTGSEGLNEQNRTVVINVYGAEGQNVSELAEIISQKIAFGYRQEQMAWA